MRNSLSLLGTLTLLAVLGAGCAGPEKKLGRGVSNTMEFARGAEFERAIEQGSIFDGPDVGLTTGVVTGVSRTLGRTGMGLFEVVTFPIPSYDPIWTRTFTPKPVYPDSYQPLKMEDASSDTDHYFGFSGGDVAPFFMGSRFRIFDN